MDKTHNTFITLLKDHLHSSPSIIQDSIDWDELVHLAEDHEVSGMIYHQLKGDEHAQLFQEKYGVANFYYANRNRCFEIIRQEFEKENIPYAVVKGQAIAHLYPYPSLRTMGDIDILIDIKDQESIRGRMKLLKYEELNDTKKGELKFQNRIIEFEMHSLLIYPDEHIERNRCIEFFNDFWKYVEENGQLKKEFHLLFLFIHLRKHLLYHGAGIRHFMDIAVFTNTYRDQMDWEWVKEKLEYLNLSRFAEVIYTFIARWFEFESPLDSVDISDELYENSTNRILENGVFGFQASDDEAALSGYYEAKDGFRGKLKYRLSVIFPSYSLLRNMNRYSFIDGKPYLLPAAWIYRIGYTVIHRREQIRILNNKADQSRIDMIKEWGM